MNENSPNLNKELYQMMIFNIIDLYQLIAQNSKIKESKYYLLDIIIYFINKSLNLESEKAICKNEDMVKYYITLFSVNKKILEDKAKIGNIYSNIFIYNPFLLTCLTIYLIK